MKQPHTTKAGPGRHHVEGTNRGSSLAKAHRLTGTPGSKLHRKMALARLTKRW